MCRRMRMIALGIGLSAVLCLGGCGQNDNHESMLKQESTTSAETSKKPTAGDSVNLKVVLKNTNKKKAKETSKKASETKDDSTKNSKKTDTKDEVTKNETSKKVADNKNNSSNKNTGNSGNNNNNGNVTKPSNNSGSGTTSKPSGNSSSGGSSKPSTPSSNPAPTTSQGSSSGGGSSSSGNITKPSTPQPSTSAPKPETQAPETEHKHNWVEQSHVVHHDATGHYEDVVISDAWDEPVYDIVYKCICNGCGADITNCIIEHGRSQALLGNFACGAYTSTPFEGIVDYIHHDAVTESRWVEDSSAYNETVVDGYKCSSCGATK